MLTLPVAGHTLTRHKQCTPKSGVKPHEFVQVQIKAPDLNTAGDERIPGSTGLDFDVWRLLPVKKRMSIWHSLCTSATPMAS